MKTTINFILMLGAFIASSLVAQAQVKIGTNTTVIAAGSALEIESADRGLRMPQVALTNTTTWAPMLGSGSAATSPGMHVYNTNSGITSTNTNYPTLAAKIGEYYWDGTGWVALAPAVKTTAISSFAQQAGASLSIAPGAGGSFCAFPTLGSSPPPACAIDLNRNASFTTINPVNDIIIDFTGLYSVSNNNAQVQFFIVLYMDKTTPGVFEAVDSYFITSPSTTCSGGYMNFKSAFKNLPARTYSVKAYELNWFNGGTTTAKIGIGSPAQAGCGQSDFTNQRLTISVSQ